MKKYYINDKGFLLVDENNTPYLIQNGYKEITEEEYNQKIEEINILVEQERQQQELDLLKNSNPELYEYYIAQLENKKE